MKGSVISDHVVNSFSERQGSYYKLRLKLMNDGIISSRVFKKNYEFSSPSAASAVILGHASNGNADWKTEDGTELRNILLTSGGKL